MKHRPNIKLSSIKIIFILLFGFQHIIAQETERYWITFKSKDTISFSKVKPDAYLSLRALNRRLKHHASVTIQDFPVTKSYIDSIKNIGINVLYSSRWFNAITIETKDKDKLESIRKLSFVAEIQKTKSTQILKLITSITKTDIDSKPDTTNIDSAFYGHSYTPIKQMNGMFLHEKNFYGSEILIALLDAGFNNAQNFKGLQQLFISNRIQGSFDFVKPAQSIYNSNQHGSMVLSAIASNWEDTLTGTAPAASYLLLRSEDSESETISECDNWIAAAEFADSAGADIISSSLGYTVFENSDYDFIFNSEKDRNSRISKAADIASSKGILVMASAGNDGNKQRKYTGEPANAKTVLAVGAIDSKCNKAQFSSFGPSSFGEIKPDIIAMGQNVKVEISPDSIASVSGTSFSCPIVAGLAACLMQAFPNAKASDIKRTIIESSTNYQTPNDSIGYGIPDFKKAYAILSNTKKYYNIPAYLIPNPFINNLILKNPFIDDHEVLIECYSITGEKFFSTITSGGYSIISDQIADLTPGLYFFKCTLGEKCMTIKGIRK